jgi:hypothetical protein
MKHFVVQCLFPLWLRLCRVGSFVVKSGFSFLVAPTTTLRGRTETHEHVASAQFLRRKIFPAALLLIVIGLSSVISILAIELFHRFKVPYRALGGAQELPQFRRGAPNTLSAFVVDPDFGFRPILGVVVTRALGPSQRMNFRCHLMLFSFSS